MDTTLLTAIIICTVGIGAYLAYLFIGHKKPGPRDIVGLGSDGDINERAISDNPIYQETKTVVAELRSGLDRFQELVDACFSSKSMSSQEILKVACEESFPAMYEALGESRKAALKLLSSVRPEPESDGQETESNTITETLSAPPADTKITPSKIDRVDGLLRRIQVIVDGVGPCIAHFYMALTISDEKSRLKEASLHAIALVHHLDDSIYELKKMEQILLT